MSSHSKRALKASKKEVEKKDSTILNKKRKKVQEIDSEHSTSCCCKSLNDHTQHKDNLDSNENINSNNNNNNDNSDNTEKKMKTMHAPATNISKGTSICKGKITKFVGGHVSIQKSFTGAVEEALAIGARSFALFTGSQRSWTRKPITPDAVTAFSAACKKHNFPPHLILPHGSYLVNLANADSEKLKKSKQGFIEEIQRCEQLGLVLYNFHPGSCVGYDDSKELEQSLVRVAEGINEAHKQTKSVITVIENTAGQGNSIGHSFEQIGKIIEHVTDKSRVGVCLDTCHAFAAGYDLRTKESCTKVFEDFEKKIGFKYLKGMHLNDSKQGLNCRVDRHENIGKGEIGLEGFRFIMNDQRFDNIPLILETAGPYDKEIQLLDSLVEKSS